MLHTSRNVNFHTNRIKLQKKNTHKNQCIQKVDQLTIVHIEHLKLKELCKSHPILTNLAQHPSAKRLYHMIPPPQRRVAVKIWTHRAEINYSIWQLALWQTINIFLNHNLAFLQAWEISYVKWSVFVEVWVPGCHLKYWREKEPTVGRGKTKQMCTEGNNSISSIYKIEWSVLSPLNPTKKPRSMLIYTAAGAFLLNGLKSSKLPTHSVARKFRNKLLDFWYSIENGVIV